MQVMVVLHRPRESVNLIWAKLGESSRSWKTEARTFERYILAGMNIYYTLC